MFFPELAPDSDPGIARLLGDAVEKQFSADLCITSPGDVCEYYPLIVDGSIRVQCITDSGREITLYHNCPGDTCVLSTSCLISGEPYPAEAITETDTIALMCPRPSFLRALEESALFRRFVFARLSRRLGEVIVRFESVQSKSIDRDLAAFLLKYSREDAPVAATQEALARELGAARESVSRHIKRFESRGWVRLERGTIHVVERALLAQLANKQG